MTIPDPSPRNDRYPIAVTTSVYPYLLNLARLLSCPDSAEDWVQEALIETLRRHPGYSGIADPHAYTRTVLLRLVTRGRVRARRLKLELGGDSVADSIEAEDSIRSVASRLHTKEMLARLPIRQRACVYLNVVCGLSDRESAELLGCRPSTVRSNVARALARLAPDPTEPIQ